MAASHVFRMEEYHYASFYMPIKHSYHLLELPRDILCLPDVQICLLRYEMEKVLEVEDWLDGFQLYGPKSDTSNFLF